MKSIVTAENPSKIDSKLLSLQLLRGIAAILVVYAHAIDNQIGLNIGKSFQQNFYYLENFGAVGVDIFFVLSGFIISLVARRYLRPNGFKDFIVKRFIRVVPIYWIITLIILFISIFTLNNSTFTARIFLKSFLILPIFDSGWFSFSILLVGWTLAFEVYFYFVVSIFIAFKSKYFLVYSFLFMTLLVLAGAIFNSSNNVLFKFVSNPLNLEFAVGLMIGMFYNSKIRLSHSFSICLIVISLFWLGITLVVGYGDISEAERIVNGNFGWLRICTWGIPSALLVTGFVFLESFLSTSIFRYFSIIGDASYSIYLTHYLTLSIFSNAWSNFKLLSPDIFILTAIVFSVLSGIAVFLIIEKRMIKYLNCQYSLLCKKRKLPSI